LSESEFSELKNSQNDVRFNPVNPDSDKSLYLQTLPSKTW